MNPILLLALTFLAGASTVIAVVSLLSDVFLRDREKVGRRITGEFRRKQHERVQRSLLFKDLGRIASELADTGERTPIRQRIATMIDQAGLDLTVERLLVITAGLALTLGALGGLLRGSPIVALIAAAVGAVLPFLFVQIQSKRRTEKLRSQLPDAFDLMARVVRAGQTMAQAQQATADEFETPIAAEFSLCFEQQNLGLAPEIALRDLARRTGLLEMKIFVTALLVQQQAGGNLAELLEKLAAVVRERFVTRGKILTLTAEGRLQGLVLLCLPTGLFFIMLTMNREFTGVLLDYPKVLLGVLAAQVVGALWVRKIVNFDY
jgi:tight adherence protein B